MWTEESEDQLISLIQERPALYDIAEKHYSNRAVKADLWREIEAKLQLSGSTFAPPAAELGDSEPRAWNRRYRKSPWMRDRVHAARAFTSCCLPTGMRRHSMRRVPVRGAEPAVRVD